MKGTNYYTFMTKVILILVVSTSSLFLSCAKEYSCFCDADGVAPMQNDYIYDTQATSKVEARDKCRSYGDECGSTSHE